MTKDSAYDSGGRKESVPLERDNAFDGERYSNLRGLLSTTFLGRCTVVRTCENA